MQLNLGIWNLPWLAFTLEQALDGLSAVGIERVLFYPQHADGPCYDNAMTKAEAAAFRARVEEHGLQISGLMAVHPDKGSLDDAKRRIDLAVELGATYLMAAGSQSWVKLFQELKPADQQQREHEAFVAHMRQVAPYAEAAGVTVTLKPHTGDTATGPILRRTLDEIASPAVRAAIDLGNVSFYEGIKGVEDADPVLHLASILCLKDHCGPQGANNFPVIGEGDLDYPALLAKLRDADFSGVAFIERFEGTLPAAERTFDVICERAIRSKNNILDIAGRLPPKPAAG